MRRFIIASHHLFACGLKDTLQFLTSRDDIVDISAYIDDSDLDGKIKRIFETFSPHDEVIIMTDMLGGSVNQKFCPYMNNHIHLICGINLPCALSLMLQPEAVLLDGDKIHEIVEEARKHLIYVNDYQAPENQDDE